MRNADQRELRRFMFWRGVGYQAIRPDFAAAMSAFDKRASPSRAGREPGSG
jgi:hypothetical protein